MDQIRVKGGVLLGALVSGALAAGALGAAPTADATCASFFGLGNGADCTSNLTSVAIAIGTGATAHADGLFGAAFSTGTKAEAFTENAFDFATAVGDSAEADAGGVFGISMQLGANGFTETFGPAAFGNLGLNIAISVSPGNTAFFGSVVEADGVGNVAINLFGNGTTPSGHAVRASGIFSVATNIGGTNNKLRTGQGGGALNQVFSIFGSGNTVKAGPGPFAIAGSIGQTGQTITKVGPGFNINGIVVGGAAAVPPNATSGRTIKPAAAATRSTKPSAAAARSTRK